MKHIGITAHIKDFEVPPFVGYFKIQDEQDLSKSAAVACKRYAERKNWPDFLARLKIGSSLGVEHWIHAGTYRSTKGNQTPNTREDAGK